MEDTARNTKKERKRRIRMWKVRCDYRRNKYTRGGRRNGRENVAELASRGGAKKRDERERKGGGREEAIKSGHGNFIFPFF